jgi:hypothetical protein
VPAGAAVRTRRGTPSFSTLLFFAFIAITALRVLGQVNAPSTVPGPVVTPVPEAATPGPGITEMPADVATVAFGTASDENCGVTGADVEFKAGTSVWWSAQLTTLQSGDSGAFVIIRRDGNEISSDKMPPAEPSETWDQLCSTDPVAETGIGTYRIEVWDLSISVVLAAGEYRVSV